MKMKMEMGTSLVDGWWPVNMPEGVACNPRAELLLSNTWAKQVFLLSPRMDTLRQLPYKFDLPKGVNVGSRGELLVADTNGGCVRIFSPDGAQLIRCVYVVGWS